MKLFSRIFPLSKSEEKKLQYLTSLGPLTDEGFIHGGKGGSVVVDVQQANIDGNMAALTRIIWKANTEKVSHFAPLLHSFKYSY